MINYTLYNNTGEIVGNCYCTAEEIEINKGSYEYIEGKYSSDFGYISNGVYVDYTFEQLTLISDKPKTHHEWNNNIMGWVDIRPIDVARMDKRAELNIARDKANMSPILFGGNYFDADEAAIRNITGAIMFLPASHQLQWTLANNTQVDITVGDLQNLGTAIVARSAMNHYRCVALKESLDAMSSNEEINSVVF